MMMKSKNITAIMLLLFISFTAMYSCQKDDSEKEYGFSKIYMPQSISLSAGINNNYPVPAGTDSSTYNYSVDTNDKKIKVTLGSYLSGPVTDAYSVDINVDNDTIQQLLNNKTLDPALYTLLPAAMYTLPTRLDVPGRSATFDLAIDIAQLKSDTYKGKKLVLAVKLTNPTKFELNTALSTTIVIVDVDALVIGPAVNVTTQYIKNPGNPFIADGFMSGSTRWGNLRDWSANAAARSHGGFGGFNSDNGGTMDMESGWGSPQILNGKIYQTVTLPAGTYSFDLSGGNWSGGENFMKDIGYAVVAPNLDTLPDYSDIANNTSVFYQAFAKPVQPVINFQLSATTRVTLGAVVDYEKTEQGFKTKQVILLNYPKHL